MNDILYITILVILTIFILFYGGHNNINTIIYDNYKYFDIYKKISLFDNKFIKISKHNGFTNVKTNITNNITHFDYILPNVNNLFYIKLQPHKILNINNNPNILLLVYNFTNSNIDLIIDYDNNNYLYKLGKFNIVKPYNIINNSNYTSEFVICEINKPFWYY